MSKMYTLSKHSNNSTSNTMSKEMIVDELSSDVGIGESEKIQIDKKAEDALVRKLDRYLMPIFCMIFFLSFLDRSNIGNARVVGLQEQLGLTNQQYSTSVSVFYATYIAVELPGVLLVKRIGPRRYMAFAMFCWSMVTIFTCFVRSYGGLLTTRLLLGFFEGSVFPSQSLYITMTYKRHEQTKRQGYLYVCSCASGAFGGLIATAIVKIKPRGNFLNWSWLYVIEGSISLFAAIIVFFALPDDPKTAYFLNEDEKRLMSVRYEQQQEYHGNQKFDKSEVFNAFKDPKVWISCAIQFCVDLVLYGYSTFLPSILKLQLGYSTIEAQYLTIPVYVVSAIAMATVAYLSDRYRNKSPLILGLNALGTIGYIILLASTNGKANYFATYLIAFPLYGSVGLSITWLNNNMAPHYRRATSLGLNQMLGNVSGAVAGQIYTSAPYTLGNSFSLGCSVIAMILTIIQVQYLKMQNSIKEKVENGEMEDPKKERVGSDSLNFKYFY